MAAPTTCRRAVDSGAIRFTGLTVFLQIRHYATGGDIFAPSGTPAKIALQVSVGLGWRSGSSG